MDKICYRNPSKSEVIGRCVAEMKKPNDHAEPTKVELKKVSILRTRTTSINYVV